MTDITDLEKNIQNMLESLDRDIEGIQKKDPSQRQKQMNRCQNRLVEVRTNIEAYELEMLQLDKNSQASHRESFKTLQARYKGLKSKFDRKKAEKPDDALMPNQEGREKKIDEMTGDLAILILV